MDCAGISVYDTCVLNVSEFKCENHRGYKSSCISTSNNSIVLIFSDILSMNTKSTISLIQNTYFVIVSSSFINNFTPDDKGGVIFSENST